MAFLHLVREKVASKQHQGAEARFDLSQQLVLVFRRVKAEFPSMSSLPLSVEI